MKHVPMLVLSLCMALGIAAPAAAQMQGADPMQSRDQMRMQEQDQIYGSELMTTQERNEYQARMRAATTEQEREAIRLEHHNKMQVRAKAQGKTLPDMPPADRGPGMMGPGGKGMGPGGRGGYGY